MDFASDGTQIYQLRTFLGKMLRDFQADLEGLEETGLERHQCEQVKTFLTDMEREWKTLGTPAGDEVAKLVRLYREVYAEWNGSEGRSEEHVLTRRKQLEKLAERKSKLFRKLAARQQELARDPQLGPFTGKVLDLFFSLAERLPEQLPNVRQAITRLQRDARVR
jgi:hypothetical protein